MEVIENKVNFDHHTPKNNTLIQDQSSNSGSSSEEDPKEDVDSQENTTTECENCNESNSSEENDLNENECKERLNIDQNDSLSIQDQLDNGQTNENDASDNGHANNVKQLLINDHSEKCEENDEVVVSNEIESKVASLVFTDGRVVQLNYVNIGTKDTLVGLNVAVSNFLHDSSSFNLYHLSSKGVHEKVTADLKKEISCLRDEYQTLECQNVELNQNLRQLQEKLSAHDVAAKRTIARLQQDSENKIKELNKMCAQVKSEQQTSVMNFARREKEVLDLRQKKDAAEMYARNTTKERERAVAQLKTVKADFIKCKNMLERKEGEYNAQKQEVEKLKEEINSQIIKVRWAQNKLKTEVDSHKETKEKCDKMVAEIQQAKEETEQIRKNCQGMIKTYQESEEIKSNALDIELKEKLQTLNEKETETMEVRAVLKQKSEELNMIKIKHKDLLKEEKVLKSRVECLETERLNNEQVLRGYEEVMNKQKLSAGDMANRLQAMDKLQEELATVTTECNEMKSALEEATEKCETALSDLACKEEKEQELLQFTERMSSKNTELAVKVEELNTKVTFQTEEIDSLKGEKVQLLSEIQNVSTTLGQQMSSSQKSTTDMTSRLQEKEKTICQLLLQIEDLKDEMRTVKRKNNACVKDLTRQLTQAKRKMDNADALSNSSGPTSTNHSADCGSMGSRASSTNSLDRMHSYPETNGSANPSYEHVSVPETTITGPGAGPADRQMLIERIVRLQQIHAKKNDKIDFLQEHVQQLVEELQKKHRLIQHYVMREEAGVLAPPRENKDFKPKHGLTLDLSLEINRKMQSVLEDTLLKNITLKESLEMLGKEVQKLQVKKTTT